ncbi:MAG: preprotein translocase subunit YajC [Acidobacteriota bacterium]|nr:preprotein translocase subunit YajC [Acidobacteriota bacterium]
MNFLETGASGSILSFAPILIIFGIFYFLLFMPMQKQKKQQAKMLAEIKNGDVVVTTGGIVGTVTSIDSEFLTLRVKPDNLKLQFSRNSVSSLAESAKS